jgi:hypothetical protein
VAVGLAALVVDSMVKSIFRTLGHERAGRALDDGYEPAWDGDEFAGARPRFVPLLAGAAFGLTLEAARAGARIGWNLARTGTGVASVLARPSIARASSRRVRRRLATLDARWQVERARDERAGSRFVASIIPTVAAGVLDRLDLTELVLGRLDLDRIVTTIDVDAIVQRLDLAGIARDVIEQLDLAEIARSVIEELDLASIASTVIDEIDLPAIVRQSTGTLADETAEGIRAQGVHADRAVSRVVDRLLGRDGVRVEQELPS